MGIFGAKPWLSLVVNSMWSTRDELDRVTKDPRDESPWRQGRSYPLMRTLQVKRGYPIVLRKPRRPRNTKVKPPLVIKGADGYVDPIHAMRRDKATLGDFTLSEIAELYDIPEITARKKLRALGVRPRQESLQWQRRSVFLNPYGLAARKLKVPRKSLIR